MKVLAVETATRRQSVAILDGTKVLARSDEDAQGAHARRLVPTIDRLLAQTGVALAGLDGLAVSIGPGSFTGLRVGLATMMGFRTVADLPLATVPTLEAMAWNHREVGRIVCPILQARTGEVYWALYRWTSDTVLIRVAEERAGTIRALGESITDSTLVLGEGWEGNKDELQLVLGERMVKVEAAPPEAMAVSAVSVGLAGLERLTRGERAGQGVAPLYVQRAEAEVAWERRAPALASVQGRGEDSHGRS
ncbi:MAG: tRNA (adenosine(37)-N6)-threonylcarbamoyltransferase complex dimerization subunit type 1 TsaB [Nitrospira sp.]|nr:tRNA (adenosine(37)-N6)-threonylcarbamoyltransferase complex dimerization subunit type 1 TsaB [Nitrospira sp.]